MRSRLRLLLILLAYLVTSCQESKVEQMTRILKNWEEKEILFPSNPEFSTIKNGTQKFSIPASNYKILVYVDSIGCISCKLKIDKWMEFMSEVDSVSSDTVPFLFFFHPKSEQEIRALLKVHKFNIPFCIDMEDKLNKLNNFPDDSMLQTFLIDKNNKVKAIGNPILNRKIRKLYLNIITGEDIKTDDVTHLTSIKCSTTKIDMGHFKWQEKVEREVTIQNTGKVPLVINDVTTSCGCTTVNYDKAPVPPNGSISFHICYQAEHPEYFNKTVSIYCNTASSPIVVKIKGNAEK